MEIVNRDIFRSANQKPEESLLIEEIEGLKAEVSSLSKQVVELTESLSMAESAREQVEKEAWDNYAELVALKKAAWDIMEETSTITGVENPFPALEALLMSMR